MPSRVKQSVNAASIDKRAILLAHPLFGALGADAIDRLSSYAVTQRIKRGTTLFSKGDTGASVYAVCRGTVKISVPSESGKDAVFNLIGPGQIFGEIALLDGGQRTADAIAASDCELLVIERRDFIPLIRQQPELALKLIELLCSRLRNTSEQVEDVIFLDLPARLAKALLRLHQSGTSSAAGAPYMVVITQKEIGQIIGMSRESTNKQLREWEARKWVKIERGGVAILNPSALAALVTADRDLRDTPE
jgi:CRP/FNR family transcriptional regulator, cyclic AMP receptor protein